MIKAFFKMFVFIFLFSIVSFASAQEVSPTEATKEVVVQNLNQLCEETYQKEATCPKSFCKLVCLEGESAESCHLNCEPRPCIELPADHCPIDACQVLDGCKENTKRCYPKMVQEPGSCGDLAYSGNLECCKGFVKRCGVEFFDGSCDMNAEFTVESVPQCVPCGNGICNQFENKCNCPEDCND